MTRRRSLWLAGPALCLVGCFVTTDESLWQMRRDAAADSRRADGSGGERATDDGAQADAPAFDLLREGGSGEGSLPLGADCIAGAECQSTFCVDGVCCNSACTAPCQLCSLPASKGTCSSTPVGTDPDNDCTQDPVATCSLDGTCDGAGACRKYPSGTPCSAPVCVDAETLRGKICNGGGQCLAGTDVLCVPFKCDATTNQCFTSCSSDSQCSRFRCDTTNGVCFSSCTSVAQCQSPYKCKPNGKCG